MFSRVSNYANPSFVIENNYFFNCASIGITSNNRYLDSKFININNITIPSDPFKNRDAFDLRLDGDALGGNFPRFGSLLENFSPSITRRNKDIGSIQSYSKAIKINMNGGMRG